MTAAEYSTIIRLEARYRLVKKVVSSKMRYLVFSIFLLLCSQNVVWSQNLRNGSNTTSQVIDTSGSVSPTIY